jgi:hypothetical protein
MAVLALLLGPMAISVTGCFTLGALVVAGMTHKDPRIVPAGDAIYLDAGQELTLHLRDGSTVHGRFVRRTLLEPDRYRPRFEASSARGGWTPFALGESLTVETADGKRMTAPFAGYAVRALVLRLERDGEGLRVPFESARSVRRAGGGVVSLDSLLAAEVRGELPSAEAIALNVVKKGNGIAIREGGPPHAVPLEDVERVTVSSGSGSAAGLIVLGVAVDVVLLVTYLHSIADSGPSCDYRGPTYAAARVTERPFDRRLGRFVEENLAGEDSVSMPEPVRDPAAERSAVRP